MDSQIEGYPRSCRVCENMIWMQMCSDGRWKPFDFPDSSSTGNWDLHNCSGDSK
jgi:hypothetical protein